MLWIVVNFATPEINPTKNHGTEEKADVHMSLLTPHAEHYKERTYTNAKTQNVFANAEGK